MNIVWLQVFIVLMLIGNLFALWQLFTAKTAFMEQFPRITEGGFQLFRVLPLLNIAGLVGLWLFKPWAPWLTLGCGLLVIGFDIFFNIRYHLWVAIPSFLLLLFFIILYWNRFNQ